MMRRHFSSVIVGLITSIDNLGYGLAFATILFPASLAAGLGPGIGVILLSSAILPLVIGLRSGQPNAIALVQDTSIGIMASCIAAIAASMTDQPEHVRVATAFAILGTGSVATGTLFWVSGRLRLGGLVRFLPYPVVAGFLAGSGWLLVYGAVSTLTGDSGWTEIASSLAKSMVLAKVVPAVAFALTLIWALRRFSHPMTMAFLLVGAGVLFYAALWKFGISAEQARGLHWLISLPNGGAISLPHPNQILRDADWWQVTKVLPVIASAAILNMVGVLLNASGMELALGRELDVNAELRSSGQANLLVGLFCGPVGFADLSMTLLAEKMGVKDRGAGIATALMIGAGLLFASTLASAMPSFLSAGLMLFLGIELLNKWVVESRRRLPIQEWLVVIGILAGIVLIGFMAGLALGLAFSTIMFIYNYSRLSVVRQTSSGVELRSNVDRSPSASRFLNHNGAVVHVIQLQDYLFFGTAEQVVSQVRQRLNAEDLPPLRFLILDFKGVSGIDSAATSCFLKICAISESYNVRVQFSGLPKGVLLSLTRAGLQFAEDSQTIQTPDMDHALEWCEEELLAEEKAVGGPSEIVNYLESVLGSHQRLADMVSAMERLDLAPGTKLIGTGDPAGDVFVLGDGRIKVQLNLPNEATLRLRTMTSGAVVGEVALYLGGKRTADVIVEVPSVIWRLSLVTLNRLEREDSDLAVLFHRLLAVTLSEKLVQANRLIKLSH